MSTTPTTWWKCISIRLIAPCPCHRWWTLVVNFGFAWDDLICISILFSFLCPYNLIMSRVNVCSCLHFAIRKMHLANYICEASHPQPNSSAGSCLPWMHPACSHTRNMRKILWLFRSLQSNNTQESALSLHNPRKIIHSVSRTWTPPSLFDVDMPFVS